MNVRKTTVLTGLACGILLAGNSPAWAASDTAYSTDGGTRGASTYYNDNGDSYTVCDRSGDYMRAVGWIEVRQEDGSWNRFAKVEAVGEGVCNGNNVDVIRENADVRITACRQNGAFAQPQDCGWKIIPGS
jgi:hypothetical protein